MARLALLVLVLMPVAAQVRHVVLISLDGFANYHLDNPALVAPNIRALAARGVRAEASESVFPSVTHPSHTSIITGMLPRKHGVLGNDLADRKAGGVIRGNSRNRAEIILSKTLFDAAKAKGLTTAAFHWPETLEDPNIDYNLVARAEGGARRLLETAAVRELRAAGIPIDSYARWRNQDGLWVVMDALTVEAACHILKVHKPGLTAVHLVNPDHEQHTYGPASALAAAALSKADYNVGQLVRAMEEAGLAANTTFVVTADHGFATVEYELSVRPFFAAAGLLEKVRLHGGGWTLFLQLAPDFDAQKDGPLLESVLRRLRESPHIRRVYHEAEFPLLGWPRYEESPRVPGQYLILAGIETYLTAAGDAGELRRRTRPAHSHGYLPSHPLMHPVLVFSGAGIRRGARLGPVRQIDIAPTIGRLLGLDALDYDGRVLEEILE